MAEKYVPIFFDWIEATEELNDQEKGRLIDAIVLYARGGDWQDRIKGNERYSFPVFRLQVDRAKNISSVRAAARTNGNKTEQTEQNGTNDNKTPNNNNNEYKNKNKNENKNNNEGDDKKRKRFNAPTADEVENYAQEMGYDGFSAQRFIAYYESNGWKVGRNPMKDWKAAVRNWAARDKGEAKPQPDRKSNPALDYAQRKYSDDDYGDDFFIDLEA